MREINQVLVKGLLSVLLTVFVVSCASMPELKVLYKLPAPSNDLKGKKVFLAVEDARKTKELFGEGAKQEFGNYIGNISLSVARYNETGFKIGPFQLPAMVKEGFKKRLENAGLEVLSGRSHGEPQLLIVINSFILDLVDRTWIAKMSYEAKLMKDEAILAAQIIEGEAERVKVIGRKEADTVTGEIFTDMVNRLDLLRLFRQAKL
ncbi:MAG: hypothetical protein IMF11_11840 [Proteobacteria bacterium]|nr:hypothetical protein [Pseudomonadota bacterium]